MTEETKRLLNNLSLLSSKLYDYVEDDDQIKDEEIDELDFAVRTIRTAILNIEHLEEWLSYTKAVAEANQERAEEAERLEIENDKLKNALGRASLYLEWKVTNTFYQDNGKEIAINKKPYMTKEQWEAWLLNYE